MQGCEWRMLVCVPRELRHLQPCVTGKLRRYCHRFCVAVASRRSAWPFGESWLPLRRYLCVALAKLRRFLRR